MKKQQELSPLTGLEITVTIHPLGELFHFIGEDDWINHAQMRFRNHGHTSQSAICVDATGKVCTRGLHIRENEPLSNRLKEGKTMRTKNELLAELKRLKAGVTLLDCPPWVPEEFGNYIDDYVDEFTWRLNEGNVANHTTERLDSFVDATVGKRLTYKRLCA
jgi:hypothetical protein